MKVATQVVTGNMVIVDHKDPIRSVLFIIDSYYGRYAGAEGALARIVRNLPRDRFRCSVVAFSTSAAQQQSPSVDCPFHVIPFERKRPWSVLTAAWKIRKIIRQQKVDVVHTFFELSHILGGLVAWLSGVPVLVSSRRDMGIRHRPKVEFAYRLANSLFDQIQAVSEEVRAFCIDRERLRPDKVVTVPNGVEMDRLSSAAVPDPEDRPILESASHVIVSVGNVRHIKGFDILLRAAPIVLKEFPKAVFLLVGQPHKNSDCYRRLEELRGSLQLTDKVLFVGQRLDVYPILKRSDIFCLLSRSEGMSNAILEAMAARLPVIATNVGGNAELVEDGQTGFLVPSENSEIAAARIIDLLRQPARLKQMGQAGFLKIQSGFTAQVMANRMAGLYQDLLTKKKR